MAPAYHTSAIHAIVRMVNWDRTEWDHIKLNDTEIESLTFRQLQQEFKLLGVTERALRPYSCTYAVLPRSFDEYLAS